MIVAHGLGGSTDLPIPATFVLIGGAWALTVSFVVLIFAWRRPRLDRERCWTSLPTSITRMADATSTRVVVRSLGSAFAVYVTVSALVGPSGLSNPVPGVVYVYLWVGVPVLSGVLGPLWRLISPLRGLYLLVCSMFRRTPATGLMRYPDRLGSWPAVGGLFAFVWLELASSDPGSLSAIGSWFLAYAVMVFGGAIVFGEKWFANADPFEKFSETISAMAVLARRKSDRSLVLRNPLDGLPSLPVAPGTVAVIAVLLGSTAFDSAAHIPGWLDWVDAHSSSATDATWWRTAGLSSLIVLVGLVFWVASRATGGMTRARRAELPGLLAHSLIPIVVGYLLAHYLTYLVEKGQATAILLADPFAQGWDLLGQQRWEVSYVLSEHPALLATVKVLCVLGGHVLGVVSAHDASLRLLPAGHRLTGQLGLMVVMVLYTFGGLFLLFGG